MRTMYVLWFLCDDELVLIWSLNYLFMMLPKRRKSEKNDTSEEKVKTFSRNYYDDTMPTL